MNIKNLLLCWIGNTDLESIGNNDTQGCGPIMQALKNNDYDKIIFLDNYQDKRVADFIQWVKQESGLAPEVHSVNLSSPTDHKEIYVIARKLIQQIQTTHPQANLTFHTSPGTPAMALCWFLLAPMCGAKLIESSRGQGVRAINFPFELAAHFLPDKEITRLTSATAPIHAAFKDIIHQDDAMRLVISRAEQVASRDLTVLIEGESGTGKELFAKAIHNASSRSGNPFVAVNCGAIPDELIESQLYGYKKGAFTGALKDTAGFFQAAEGGTLFLDELGELPPKAQVSLLRTLQEREITPVGGVQTSKVNVRIIAATNRNLLSEVAAGRFRSDLFYRLAVATLTLPPLRERPEDVLLLLDAALLQTNKELSAQGQSKDKKFSESAKKIISAHLWPGNVRELYNTVMRVVLWTPGEIIDAEDVRQALFAAPHTKDNILERPWGESFKLADIIAEVASHYLIKSLEDSGGIKSKAAALLGFDNYQTLTNWQKRYNVK